MRKYIRRKLVNLLFYLVGLDSYYVDEIQEENIRAWLVDSCFNNQYFYQYIHMRDHNILQQMGQGLSEREYWIQVGRRMEVAKHIEIAKESAEKRRDQ